MSTAVQQISHGTFANTMTAPKYLLSDKIQLTRQTYHQPLFLGETKSTTQLCTKLPSNVPNGKLHPRGVTYHAVTKAVSLASSGGGQEVIVQLTGMFRSKYENTEYLGKS